MKDKLIVEIILRESKSEIDLRWKNQRILIKI